MKELAPNTYTFAEYELDLARRLFLRAGQSIPLNAKTFDLLVVLIENRERVIAKEELINLVWRDQFVEEANLTVQISALRRVLGEKKGEHRFIVTVPGRGYRFVAELQAPERLIIERHTVSEIVIEEETDDDDSNITRLVATRAPALVEVTPSARALTADALPGAKGFRHGRVVLLLAGGLILVLLVGGFAFRRYYSQPRNQDLSAATASTQVPFTDMKIKQLTTKGQVSWGALSPDGRFYAYVLNDRGENKNSLWLGQTDGSNEIQLRPSDDNRLRGLAFSPDSKMLYFSCNGPDKSQTGLFKMPVLGGVAEKLLDSVRAHFAISPNGKEVAFFRSSKEANHSALVIADLDGTGERELLTRPLNQAFVSITPAWSPDGKSLVVAAVNDSAKQSKEIFEIDAKDGSIKQLTTLDWPEIANIAWRRDGQGLIAVARDQTAWMTQLWHIAYPGGTAKRLSRDTDAYGSALSISDNGSSLVTVALRAESNIWVAQADDLPQARQVTFSSINGVYGWNGVDWTRDGLIVFTAGIDRSRALHSMDADGSNIRQLTSPGFFDTKPTATSDGRYIVFQSNRSGSNEVWRAQNDASDLRQLTTGGGNTAPHSTPDGKWVVYISTRDGRSFVWRIPIEGGEPVRVTDRDSSDPRVSNDGTLIACGYRADDKSPQQLAIVAMENGKPVKLFDVPPSANFNQGIRWTPDGNAVCYRDWANGIWRQEINGGPPQRLRGLPEEKIYSFGWSPDGKSFVFTRGRAIRDAVLITNPK